MTADTMDEEMEYTGDTGGGDQAASDDQIVMDDWDDTEEEVLLPDATYNLLISIAKRQQSKKGLPQLFLTIMAIDHQDTAPIFHYMTFPPKSDDSRGAGMMRRDNKRLCIVLGIDGRKGVTAGVLTGKKFQCPVGQEAFGNEMVNKLDLPKFE